MIELKDKVLASESTKSVWRKNHNSIEWQNASKLNKFLFGKSLNQNAKCECIEDLFMMLKANSINQKIINKMEKEFIFKKGVILQTNGHGVLTESSSDEKCMRFLNDYPNAIKNFKSFPKDWEKKCAEFVGAKKEVVLTEADAEADLSGDPRPDNPTEEATEEQEIDIDAMKVGELKNYIESKGAEVPEGKKAELKAFAKTL
jgi:hypothetical protein